jgi:hypothetical protein
MPEHDAFVSVLPDGFAIWNLNEVDRTQMAKQLQLVEVTAPEYRSGGHATKAENPIDAAALYGDEVRA